MYTISELKRGMFANPYTRYVHDEARRNRSLHYGLRRTFPAPGSPGYVGPAGMKRLALLMGYQPPAVLRAKRAARRPRTAPSAKPRQTYGGDSPSLMLAVQKAAANSALASAVAKADRATLAATRLQAAATTTAAKLAADKAVTDATKLRAAADAKLAKDTASKKEREDHKLAMETKAREDQERKVKTADAVAAAAKAAAKLSTDKATSGKLAAKAAKAAKAAEVIAAEVIAAAKAKAVILAAAKDKAAELESTAKDLEDEEWGSEIERDTVVSTVFIGLGTALSNNKVLEGDEKAKADLEYAKKDAEDKVRIEKARVEHAKVVTLANAARKRANDAAAAVALLDSGPTPEPDDAELGGVGVIRFGAAKDKAADLESTAKALEDELKVFKTKTIMVVTYNYKNRRVESMGLNEMWFWPTKKAKAKLEYAKNVANDKVRIEKARAEHAGMVTLAKAARKRANDAAAAVASLVSGSTPEPVAEPVAEAKDKAVILAEAKDKVAELESTATMLEGAVETSQSSIDITINSTRENLRGAEDRIKNMRGDKKADAQLDQVRIVKDSEVFIAEVRAEHASKVALAKVARELADEAAYVVASLVSGSTPEPVAEPDVEPVAEPELDPEPVAEPELDP